MAANDHSDNSNIIRMDDYDPIDHPTITNLVEQLNETRAQLNLVLEENIKLRELLAKIQATTPVRKQPKLAHQLPCSSASVKSNSANVQHDYSVAASANMKTNKKKVFQAIDTNINTIRQTIINSKCEHFTLKQSSSEAPIKISIEKPDDISAVRCALQNSAISFHEFNRDLDEIWHIGI